MDRYRRRFWQKGVIPSIGEEDLGGTLKNGTDVSQAVHQAEINSQSESEEYSSSDESSFETLQDVPPTKSRTFPGNVFSQKDPYEDSRLEDIDFEVLDPTLRPLLVKDGTETEELGSLWQQRSKLSQSPAVDFKREASVPHTRSDGISAVEGPQFSSVPQKVAFKAESQSFPSREVDRRTHGAVDINEDDHKVASEGNQTPSGIESRQIILSADAEMATKGANMSQGGQTVQQISHKTFDASYDFSDEEDEIESVQRRRPFCLPAPATVTNRHSVKTRIIDLTIEDSAPAENITLHRQALESPPRKGNRSPISISSLSSASDLSESEEVKFFLEPTPPVADSNVTLSGILGPDDFEELRKSSPIPLKQSPQEKAKFPGSGESSQASLDGVRLSPGRNPTPKRRKTISTTRASILRGSLEASPSGSMIETPGGSKRRCGENGFRCGKGFCFKCLEG
jgi:hypothetical protein